MKKIKKKRLLYKAGFDRVILRADQIHIHPGNKRKKNKEIKDMEERINEGD